MNNNRFGFLLNFAKPVTFLFFLACEESMMTRLTYDSKGLNHLLFYPKMAATDSRYDDEPRQGILGIDDVGAACASSVASSMVSVFRKRSIIFRSDHKQGLFDLSIFIEISESPLPMPGSASN